MIRKRAVMINYLTHEVLDPNYQPLLTSRELTEGNKNLERKKLVWRLRWLNKILTLAGTVELNENSNNAHLQFSTDSHCV
tara:strand:+ start:272 stop:511 length:240 start_codon:yes stop_codon:yes gene_type:complete